MEKPSRSRSQNEDGASGPRRTDFRRGTGRKGCRARACQGRDGTRMYTQEQIDDQLKIIEKAQEDIVKDYVLHGGNPEEIAKKKQRKTRTVKSVDDAIFNDIVTEKPAVKETPKEEKIESVDILPGREVFDDNESYDMILLDHMMNKECMMLLNI